MSRLDSFTSDMDSSLKVAFLYFSGMKQKEIARQLNLKPSRVSKALVRARAFVEFKYATPGDQELEAKLLLKYRLRDAVVVETGSPTQATVVVGQAAARYFVTHVKPGDRVALSCGETLLEMVKAIPSQASLEIHISQLTVEGDPSSIQQAPATLVGVLKSKLSPKSSAYATQLPPCGSVDNDSEFRRQIANSLLVKRLRKRALESNLLFVGIGAVDHAAGGSFLKLADEVTHGSFAQAVGRLGIVGEVNNRLYNEQGVDLTDEIPEISSQFVNLMGLNDLRAAVQNGAAVVAVAAGTHKLRGIRAALATGIANVIISDRETAVRLISR